MVLLISWNISWQSGATPIERIRTLLCHEPDVIALQEVRAPEACIDALTGTGLTYSCALQLDYGPGLFVASRWPLRRLPNVNSSVPHDEQSFFRKPSAPRNFEIRMLSAVVARETQPFEIHVVHVPPGSRNGWRKVDTFRAVFNRLATRNEIPRILCGDFNEPHSETEDSLTTWSKNNRYAKVAPEKWDTAVRDVILGLAEFDLGDAFRKIHRGTIDQLWSVQV